MNASIAIDPSALQQQPKLLALLVRGVLSCLVAVDRFELSRGMVPPVYDSGVRFRREEPGTETFVDALTCYRAGFGDCAHLACWRCAELRNAGKKADLFIRWTDRRPDGSRLFHVSVRHGQDGPIEDVSRNLGMDRLPSVLRI